MSDYMDKAEAWDAVAEKNERIAELEAELDGLREQHQAEVEHWYDRFDKVAAENARLRGQSRNFL